ncbi:hypothetical protein [Xanthomarina spongicola]|uniref:Uncharacterized protein n=1 Tax=Xanthomarina spongicola TaxID=570520 RepID=A0A316DTW0_9FLAO|nr:hypothetical protein [Xanthomarina spongicola]PWK20938.1 hypothetical protein LX78_00645 [Xanthomarina spongicola]
MTTTYGDLDLSDILQFVNIDGKETYSFRILNSSNTQSQIDFENLHLIKLPEDNGYLAYIIQWQPNPDWYVTNSYMFNLENFTGNMLRYDLDYNLLDSKEFESGIVINTQDDSNRDMDDGCDILQYEVCVSSGDCTCNDECYNVIEISCTGGGGGGDGEFPDPNPNENEEGSTGTHIPGGSTPGGSTGSGTFVPGGNGGVVVVPPNPSEVLTFYGMTLTFQETKWVNNEDNSDDVDEIMDFLLEHCQSVVVTDYTCEEAVTLWGNVISLLVQDDALSFEEAYFEINPNEWLIEYEFNSGEIINITEYMNCFSGASTSSSFDLTIYVDQPMPNSDDTWVNDGTIFNPDINVGHTFISIRMNDMGNIVNQTFGFYPSDSVSPTSPEINGVWVDDGGHGYDVSATMILNYSEFNTLKNQILSLGTPTYNLNTFNCTDAALQICNSSNMNLNDTAGSWIGGGGSNPGNLGQDIRTIDSSSITVNTNGGNANSSEGACP